MGDSEQGAYRFGRVEVFPAAREVRVDGLPVALGARAFDLLATLIEQRHRVVPKQELLDFVWPGLVVEEANLQVQVSVIRKQLGHQCIATITGRGYRFVSPVAIDAQRQSEPEDHDPPPVPDRPSIAVIPFANLSGDPAQEYFADGMVDDILMALSRVRWLFVIARQSSFVYKGRPCRCTADRPRPRRALRGRGQRAQGCPSCAHPRPAGRDRDGHPTLGGIVMTAT